MLTLLQGSSSSASSTTLSDIGSIAQALIAAINLVLLIYIFRYQHKQDDIEHESDENRLRLEWFRELIVKPNISNLFGFFDKVTDTCERFRTALLSDAQKGIIIAELKAHFTLIRRQFTDLLNSVNSPLHSNFLATCDQLLDGVTNTVFNPAIDLSHPDVFKTSITNNILKVKRDLVTLIIDYQGRN